MSAMQAAVGPIHCDGCTREATAEHLRRRIARLEWASRFRPVHISTLILLPAPPHAPEDYFYSPHKSSAASAGRALREDLLTACGIDASGEEWEAALRRFQHGGFFVAEAVECPVEAEDDFDALLSRLMPTLVRRVRYSYRPKSVLLLSKRLGVVAQALPGALDDDVTVRTATEPPDEPAKFADREGFRAEVRHLLENLSSE